MLEKTNDKITKKKNSLSSKKDLTKSKKSSSKKTNSKVSQKVANITTLSAKEINQNKKTSITTNKSSKIVEYYDLPYRYNQTTIKILAQTPHSLFIYWDISDSDRNMMLEKYGDNFFNETRPVLLVHNETLNYSFQVDIDDFTNSWYLHTQTSNCVYNIELGRKKVSDCINFIPNTADNILHITSSNLLESPNDRVLIQTLKRPIYLKNVKTNQVEKRNISNLANIQKIYNIFEYYNEDEFSNNPSSDFRI